jgi:hypothetical protein
MHRRDILQRQTEQIESSSQGAQYIKYPLLSRGLEVIQNFRGKLNKSDCSQFGRATIRETGRFVEDAVGVIGRIKTGCSSNGEFVLMARGFLGKTKTHSPPGNVHTELWRCGNDGSVCGSRSLGSSRIDYDKDCRNRHKWPAIALVALGLMTALLEQWCFAEYL